MLGSMDEPAPNSWRAGGEGFAMRLAGMGWPRALEPLPYAIEVVVYIHAFTTTKYTYFQTNPIPSAPSAVSFPTHVLDVGRVA